MDETATLRPSFLSYGAEEEMCPAWREWRDVFGPMVDGSEWLAFESAMVEYIAWTVIAVSTPVSISPFSTHPYQPTLTLT